VGRGHVDFSTNQQQDAADYHQHVMQIIERCVAWVSRRWLFLAAVARALRGRVSRASALVRRPCVARLLRVLDRGACSLHLNTAVAGSVCSLCSVVCVRVPACASGVCVVAPARASRTASDPGAAVGDLSKLFTVTVEEKLRCGQTGKVR
jgi:hypothetical protein